MPRKWFQISLLNLALLTAFCGALTGVVALRDPWFEKRRIVAPCHCALLGFGFGLTSPDDKFVFMPNAYATRDTRNKSGVFVISLDTGAEAARYLPNPPVAILSLGHSRSGRKLAICASCDRGYCVTLWPWDNKYDVTRNVLQPAMPDSAAFVEEDKKLLVCTSNAIRLVPLNESERVVETPLEGNNRAHLSLDRQSVAVSTTTQNGKSTALSIRNLAKLDEVLWQGELPGTYSVRVLPGNKEVLASTSKSELVRMDLATKNAIWSLKETRTVSQRVWSAISLESNQLAMADGPKIQIYDLTDAKLLHTIHPKDWNVAYARYLHNGDLLAFEESRYDAEGNGQLPMHIFTRRFPEQWWGHFYRPEVWLAIIFGTIILIQIFRRIAASRRSEVP